MSFNKSYAKIKTPDSVNKLFKEHLENENCWVNVSRVVSSDVPNINILLFKKRSLKALIWLKKEDGLVGGDVKRYAGFEGDLPIDECKALFKELYDISEAPSSVIGMKPRKKASEESV